MDYSQESAPERKKIANARSKQPDLWNRPTISESLAAKKVLHDNPRMRQVVE